MYRNTGYLTAIKALSISQKPVAYFQLFNIFFSDINIIHQSILTHKMTASILCWNSISQQWLTNFILIQIVAWICYQYSYLFIENSDIVYINSCAMCLSHHLIARDSRPYLKLITTSRACFGHSSSSCSLAFTNKANRRGRGGTKLSLYKIDDWASCVQTFLIRNW